MSRTDDATVELTLDDLDNEALSLVEQLSSYIIVHVEMLNDDEAAFGNDPRWSRERRGAELAQYEAMECLALIIRRQPDARTKDELLELFIAAFTDAVGGGDASDRQSFRKHCIECGNAVRRILRAVKTHIAAEQRLPS